MALAIHKSHSGDAEAKTDHRQRRTDQARRHHAEKGWGSLTRGDQEGRLTLLVLWRSSGAGERSAGVTYAGTSQRAHTKRTRPHTHTHTRARAPTHPNTHPHARPRAHTRERAHPHTQTPTRTQTQVPKLMALKDDRAYALGPAEWESSYAAAHTALFTASLTANRALATRTPEAEEMVRV